MRYFTFISFLILLFSTPAARAQECWDAQQEPIPCDNGSGGSPDTVDKPRTKGGVTIKIDLNKLIDVLSQPNEPKVVVNPPPKPAPEPATKPRPKAPQKKQAPRPKPKPIRIDSPDDRPEALYLAISETQFPRLRQFGQKLPANYEDPIPDEYMVVLDIALFGDNGLSVNLSERVAAVANALGLSASQVLFVSKNEPIVANLKITDATQLQAVQNSPFVNGFMNNTKLYPAASGAELAAQTTDNWALDWLDQSSNLPDGKFTRPLARYQNPVYIIDGPVMYDHPALGGKVKLAKSFADPYLEEDADICTMHGTAIAALIASETYGAAPESMIENYTVLSCSALASAGATSALLQALDDIQSKHCPSNGEDLCTETGNRPIINISMTGVKNDIIDLKLKALSDAGMVIIVAAGNEQADACAFSPAAAEGVITVGSMNELAEFSGDHSNYGECVDIAAPGLNILVPNTFEPEVSLKEYGTSLATAFVSGIVAQGLDVSDPQADVKSEVLQMGWQNVDDGHGEEKRAVSYDTRCSIAADDGFLNLRARRDLTTDPILEIPAGQKIWVFDKIGDWARVNFQGDEGWVKVKSSTGVHVVNVEDDGELCPQLASVE